MTDGNYIIASLPFDGRWIVGATPANKIPSHGTHLFGVGYAYDFMAVGDNNKVSSKITWRTLLSTEKPENFYSFGKPVTSPINGVIMKTNDGEPDNIVRRSLFAGIPYMLGQKGRFKQGIEKIAGNFVIIKSQDSENYICIVHLKKHSLNVREGQTVVCGQTLASCGNSGNSVQPHIHIQAMDSLDFQNTNGVPLYFKNYSESDLKGKSIIIRKKAFPNKNRIITSILI